MAFVVRKNPTQKFLYQKGMETLSGSNASESHTGHLHQPTRALSQPQFAQVMPSSIYTNVAMQMVPPSMATNTASGTKA